MATIKQKIGKIVKSGLPFSSEAFDILRLEFKTFRLRLGDEINPVRIVKLRKLKKSKNISLNVGAGPFGEEGWVNLDSSPLKNVTLAMDCRKRLPFVDNSVARIRCEHFLEHLDYMEEAYPFLKECHRAMISGAILRIVVPDVPAYLHAFQENTAESWARIGINIKNKKAWPTPMHVLNHVFRQDGEHKFGYDFETLKLMLTEIGFQNIKRMRFGSSADPLLTRDLENHRKKSLYVECEKP